MRNKYLLLFHLLILLSLLVWNVWIYSHRNEGFAYKEFLSYNSLYYPSNQPILKNLILLNKDSARLQFSNISMGEEVLSNFDVLLSEGKKHYSLPFANADFGIDYTSASTFKQMGSERPASLELFYSSIPFGNFKSYDLSFWQYSSLDEKNELIVAEKIISANTGLTKTATDLEKIQKIGAYLIKTLNNSRGLPIDSMDQFSPLKRYKYAISNRSKIWCGDFASILALFLKSEGIHSRLVCTEGELGDLTLGGHSMNEVYVKELKKWILVDLTSKGLLFHYQGNYLNTIDLYSLHQNQVQTIEVTSVVGDSLKTIDYENFRAFYSDYFTSGTPFIYYFKSQFNTQNFSFCQKWKRYFYPSPTFASYSGTMETNNFKFYTKQTAFIFLCLYLLYCLFLLTLK